MEEIDLQRSLICMFIPVLRKYIIIMIIVTVSIVTYLYYSLNLL